jgi:hypothetical protein
MIPNIGCVASLFINCQWSGLLYETSAAAAAGQSHWPRTQDLYCLLKSSLLFIGVHRGK